MSAIAPGNLLVATSALDGSDFAQAVIFLLEHDSDGTLGLIINRPLPAPLGMLWESCPDALSDSQACAEGGPVERTKGLLLHDCTAVSDSYRITERIFIGGETADLDAIIPTQPVRARLFLGHSGWSGGQLADELAQGAWQLAPGHEDLLFTPQPPDNLWESCLRQGPPLPEPGMN